jgi:hypothetical protein
MTHREPLVFSFEWPSVAYALDILAWDVFFALSMLFAAPVFSGSRLSAWIRALMVASGSLALVGLSGVVAGDMRLRNPEGEIKRTLGMTQLRFKEWEGRAL